EGQGRVGCKIVPAEVVFVPDDKDEFDRTKVVRKRSITVRGAHWRKGTLVVPPSSHPFSWVLETSARMRVSVYGAKCPKGQGVLAGKGRVVCTRDGGVITFRGEGPGMAVVEYPCETDKVARPVIGVRCGLESQGKVVLTLTQ
ncbi:hypothetical protein KIPB_011879, partial [Kipferlia bialata]